MRNCLVLGSGRSGTSMVAGVLAGAGYFMGHQLYPARSGNPKGFFEDFEINSVNEELLGQVLPPRPRVIGRWFYRSRPAHGQRWLGRVPLNATIALTPPLDERVRALTSHLPYCFKDPRFSYTLPAWRPRLENVVYVCVFRDPAVTAASILEECRVVAHLRHLRMDHGRAVDVWTHMYRHIVERHRFEGRWLFLHYDQVLTGEGLSRIERFVDAPVDRTFPDARLRRSVPCGEVSAQARDLYAELCRLAEYRLEAAR